MFTLLIALTPSLADVDKRDRLRGKNGSGFDRLSRQGLTTPVANAQSVTTRGGTQTLWVAPPPTGDDGTGDGSMATPYATIQFAFLQAVSGDEVRVLPGTYNECINNSQAILGVQKNLTVVADDWLVNSDRTTTIVDGGGVCGFPFSAVNIVGVGAGSRFEGFTVINAVSSGVLAAGSSVITNNIISDNMGREGGGVFANTLTCSYGNVDLEISNNQILRNTADDEGTCEVSGAVCTSDTTCGPNGPCNFFGGDGGGIYIVASVRNAGGPDGCIGGDATVTVENNVIDANGADGAFGGGLFLRTYTDAGRSVTAQVTTNLITNNVTLPFSIGYGGGAFIETYGEGTEQIDFISNTLASNVSTADGGGLSVEVDGFENSHQTINVSGNDVQLNIAEGGGGGIDLVALLVNVVGNVNAGLITADRNLVVGNEAQGAGAGGLFSPAGGGIRAYTWSERTSIGDFRIDVLENEVRSNTAGLAGGGIAAISRADSDPTGTGAVDFSLASTNVKNNLVATNLATDGAGGSTAVGGGIIAVALSNGGLDITFRALAELNLQYNTVAANASDTGSGGIEVESATTVDANGIPGDAAINIDNTIIFDNSGFAAGGPMTGNAGVIAPAGAGFLALTYNLNSLFMNDAGYQAPLFPAPSASDQFVDPLLDGGFRPTQCSPTIDAGLPASPPGAEPAPHGNAFNLGHTGGLSIATKTLADTTGDGYVDGVDILNLSVAFGTSIGDPRFDSSVDVDQNDTVDGIDMALIIANFAVSCI